MEQFKEAVRPGFYWVKSGGLWEVACWHPARGIQHQHKHGLDDAPASRDDVDTIHADLYAAWPAKRLDALIAALRSVQS